jgi:hypothetical protein
MDDKTVLLRQIEQRHIQNSVVSSLAFRPRKDIDKGLLSVYDGDLIAPKESAVHFGTFPDCVSIGVLGLTVSCCTEEKLSCRPDPEEFPEHAVIDFTPHNESQRRKISGKIKDRALARGWLFGPLIEIASE